MIPFNKPYCSGRELKYIETVCHSDTMSGNGQFTKKCHTFFEEKYGFRKCLLATSGTDALEMCAMLCDLQPGDEVIIPSYTFVSTALAFLREGAKVVFADSSQQSPNMEAEQIEPLITDKTKVIAVVHYAGVACDMDKIMALAEKHNLLVVEDAAHSIDSYYKPLSSDSFPRHGQGEVLSDEDYYGKLCYKTADPLKYNLLKENAKRMRNNPTEAEAAIWNYLRDEQCGAKFRRQHIIDDFIADFACLELRLIIEVDGGYHNEVEQKEADEARDRVLKYYGFKTLRFTNEEVLCNTDDVVARIKFAVNLQRRMVAFQNKPLPITGETGEGANGCPSMGKPTEGAMGLPLGSIGHLAAFSFHETKNISSGEGGLLVVNDERFVRRAEIIWEKGTNRAEFYRGMVNKYGWCDMGSSFLPSEFNAAYLWGQLEQLDDIQSKRKHIWNMYFEGLNGKVKDVTLPFLPVYATNNAHMFYLVCPSLEYRTALMTYLRENDVQTVFHYLPLHSSVYYQKLLSKEQKGCPSTGKPTERALPECDRYAECLVRLPLYYELEDIEVKKIIKHIIEFTNRG